MVRLVFQKDHSGGIEGDELEWGTRNLGKELGGWSDGPCKKCGDQSKAVSGNEGMGREGQNGTIDLGLSHCDLLIGGEGEMRMTPLFLAWLSR